MNEDGGTMGEIISVSALVDKWEGLIRHICSGYTGLSVDDYFNDLHVRASIDVALGSTPEAGTRQLRERIGHLDSRFMEITVALSRPRLEEWWNQRVPVLRDRDFDEELRSRHLI